MMAGVVSLACQAGLVWTMVYTSGLPGETRLRRRMEMHSELYEDTLDKGGDWSATLAILGLMLRGIPSDLMWRMDQGLLRPSQAGKSTERSTGAMQTAELRGWSLVSSVVAITAVVGAVVLMAIDNIQYSRQDNFIAPTSLLTSLEISLLVLGLVAAMTGFVVMRRQPIMGAALAVGGSLSAGIVVFWLILPLLAAIGISVYAINRARRFLNED